MVVRDVGPVHLELSRYHCIFFVYRFNRREICQNETGDIRESASHATRTDSSSTRLRKPKNSGVRLHHKHRGLDPLIRSISSVTGALANDS
jgi:predicted ArsR family transcriptional regulator